MKTNECVLSRGTFNVFFLIKKTKLLRNGEAPVCVRVTVNKRMVEMLIKRSVPAELWNQQKECSKGRDASARELNIYIESVRTRIYQLRRELETDGLEVTAIAIRDRFYGRQKAEYYLTEVYAEHNEKCKALIGKEFSESTVEKFETSLSHIREFLRKEYRTKDILLSEVNNKFISKFDFFLKTTKNCKQNSAIKHLKNLKKIIRIALANEWIKKDPFVGIQFKLEETNPQFLTQEELDKLQAKELTIARLEQVRDIFVFCCYTGLAFVDVKNLQKEHLLTDNEGNLWIRKKREKTGVMCNIPVLTPAKKILQKYSLHPDCQKTDSLLPVISNQRTNAYLKEIADLCNINKKLTTHLARHTCATVVMLANNVSMENVAKILGHANTKMTHHYAKVLDSSILRDIKAVEKTLKKIV